MIDESFIKSNFIGKDGFIWWIGQVDPAEVWRTEQSRVDTNVGEGRELIDVKLESLGIIVLTMKNYPMKTYQQAHILSSVRYRCSWSGWFW